MRKPMEHPCAGRLDLDETRWNLSVQIVASSLPHGWTTSRSSPAPARRPYHIGCRLRPHGRSVRFMAAVDGRSSAGLPEPGARSPEQSCSSTVETISYGWMESAGRSPGGGCGCGWTWTQRPLVPGRAGGADGGVHSSGMIPRIPCHRTVARQDGMD